MLMIVVVFRSRIQPAPEEAYREAAQTIVPAAMEVPGYLSHKVFSPPRMASALPSWNMPPRTR
jgi:heme-degrading monooxygenase HmoA